MGKFTKSNAVVLRKRELSTLGLGFPDLLSDHVPNSLPLASSVSRVAHLLAIGALYASVQDVWRRQAAMQ